MITRYRFSCGILALLLWASVGRAKGSASDTAVARSNATVNSICQTHNSSGDLGNASVTATPEACSAADPSLDLSSPAGRIQTQGGKTSNDLAPTALYRRPRNPIRRGGGGGDPPTSPVPEPAGLVLVGTGLVAFALFLRRRASRTA
jgi:PEP-CTERM motif